MIYVTGDTHNYLDMSNLSSKNIRQCCKEQNADYKAITCAIVLGDFGLPWNNCPVDSSGIHPTDKTDKYLLEWYNKKPFKIFAVQGNHDNYDVMERLPQVEMFGSTVLKISDNIFYFKRGEAYFIEGKQFLVLGGALSVDKEIRIPHVSRWQQEEWTETEQKTCLNKLKSKKIDYILSHTGSLQGIVGMDSCFSDSNIQREILKDSTVLFNNKIESLVAYEKWFFGHWHRDWGYEHFTESTYVPLYHKGIVL